MIRYFKFRYIYWQDIINPDERANSQYMRESSDPLYQSSNGIRHLTPLEVDQQFFKMLPKSVIKQLYDKIYKPDFEMFGYEYPQEYINMGLADVVE